MRVSLAGLLITTALVAVLFAFATESSSPEAVPVGPSVSLLPFHTEHFEHPAATRSTIESLAKQRLDSVFSAVSTAIAQHANEPEDCFAFSQLSNAGDGDFFLEGTYSNVGSGKTMPVIISLSRRDERRYDATVVAPESVWNGVFAVLPADDAADGG
ncbi:hypothetical protein [Neorhodopirellula lusitana]|uniref:hypothetical protein n=1 Tax=Neorhodopirellula lusitana TaxID=445327 RepID=UPI0024B70CBA|nr:hypothetical protein [Neorhodopirellula lusitana]